MSRPNQYPTPAVIEHNPLATIPQKARGLSGRAKLLGAGLGLAGLGAAGYYGLRDEPEPEGLTNAELAALGIGGTAALGGGLYAAGAFD